MKTRETLYDTLLDAGIEMANHCSDLYFEKNEKSDEIVKLYPDLNISTFINQVTGTIWYSAIFQYTPWWGHSVVCNR